MSEQATEYRMTALDLARAKQSAMRERGITERQNIAANRRRAELVRWQEQRERLLAIRPRSEAERQAQVQALALHEMARPD